MSTPLWRNLGSFRPPAPPLSLTLLLVVFSTCSVFCQKQPNIIFMWVYLLFVSFTNQKNFFVSLCFYSLTDDQGFADVRYTNPNLPFQTENIDKLAARSIRWVLCSIVHWINSKKYLKYYFLHDKLQLQNYNFELDCQTIMFTQHALQPEQLLWLDVTQPMLVCLWLWFLVTQSVFHQTIPFCLNILPK